jgi:hypothetical protein
VGGHINTAAKQVDLVSHEFLVILVCFWQRGYNIIDDAPMVKILGAQARLVEPIDRVKSSEEKSRFNQASVMGDFKSPRIWPLRVSTENLWSLSMVTYSSLPGDAQLVVGRCQWHSSILFRGVFNL